MKTRHHHQPVAFPQTVAQWVSAIAHPFAMIAILASTAAVSRQTPGEALRSVFVVVLFTIVPLMFLMVRQVRRGAWETVDASNRGERPLLYVVGAAGVVALLAYSIARGSPSFLVRGVLATLGMLTACGLLTTWIKVSLHTAFGALAATSLVLTGSRLGYFLIPVVGALAWARLELGRHTLLEIVAGGVIGAAAGVAMRHL